MDAKLSVRLRFERRSDLVSLIILGLLASGFLVALSWRQGAAAPSTGSLASPAEVMRREYYLTTAVVVGNQALTACATGYHMASLWEIMDTSNLDYNRTLGYALNADQGGGPPTFGLLGIAPGWVRTGGASSTVMTPGMGNCGVWTSGSGLHYGTMISLDYNWTTIDNWQATWSGCGTPRRVWCVADYAVKRIYLPLVKQAP